MVKKFVRIEQEIMDISMPFVNVSKSNIRLNLASGTLGGCSLSNDSMGMMILILVRSEYERLYQAIKADHQFQVTGFQDALAYRSIYRVVDNGLSTKIIL